MYRLSQQTSRRPQVGPCDVVPEVARRRGHWLRHHQPPFLQSRIETLRELEEVVRVRWTQGVEPFRMNSARQLRASLNPVSRRSSQRLFEPILLLDLICHHGPVDV